MPWICSFIGLRGERSEERRAGARLFRDRLAQAIVDRRVVEGFRPDAPPAPHELGVHLHIVDHRHYSAHHGAGGKAIACLERETFVLIDDAIDHCSSAERNGIIPYHVQVRANGETYTFNTQTFRLASGETVRTSHTSFPSVLHAIEVYLQHRRSERLLQKHQAIWSASWRTRYTLRSS